jgi:hypothetical protein
MLFFFTKRKKEKKNGSLGFLSPLAAVANDAPNSAPSASEHTLPLRYTLCWNISRPKTAAHRTTEILGHGVSCVYENLNFSLSPALRFIIMRVSKRNKDVKGEYRGRDSFRVAEGPRSQVLNKKDGAVSREFQSKIYAVHLPSILAGFKINPPWCFFL